uniref:Serine/arginine repetitive matrix 1 n=3 Tax=Nothobranchius rachovii TaxID=451742 RepID=A0A1A8QRW1_9TELE
MQTAPSVADLLRRCHTTPKRAHKVDNPEEHQLLLKLANKRVFYRYEPCPVSGYQYQSSRCDRHLETSHPELTAEQLDRAVQSVQKRVTVRQLAALRATAPHPPMDEDDDPDMWSDEEAEPQASCRGCNTLVRKYEGVKRQLDNLRKTFRLYHRRLSKFERRTGTTPALQAGRRTAVRTDSAERGQKKRVHPIETVLAIATFLAGVVVILLHFTTTLPPITTTLPPIATTLPPITITLRPINITTNSTPALLPNTLPTIISTTVPPPIKTEDAPGCRLEGPDSPPTSKNTRKTRHTGGSPPPEEFPVPSPEESQPPRKETPRQNPASLLSGFSSLMKECLDDYRAFLRGIQKSKKQIDNVASKVMRIRRFLNFMAVWALRLWDWSFLTRTERVMEWVGHLKRYFKETPPPHCRLKGAQITAVLRTILQCITPLLRDVSVHQMKVKEAMQMRVVSMPDLNLCRQRCRDTIPQLLERLETQPTDNKGRYRFFGYLAAFIASIYGHRTGVIANMTVTEVMNARKNAKEDSPGFVINIAEHKTNRFFGYAQVFLHPVEFSWMERRLAVRRQLKPEGDLFFFGATAQPNKNLVRYMQAAWEEMGLSGKPTFTDLRTAIASHLQAKERHVPQVREMISAAMCHDVRMADKAMFEQATDTQEDPAPSNVSLKSRMDPGTEDTSGLTHQLPPVRKALRRRRDTSSSTEAESEGHVSYQESGSSESAEDEGDHDRPGTSTPVRGAQPEPTAPELPVEPPPLATSTPVRGSQPEPTAPQLPVNPSEAGQPQEPEPYTGPSTITRRSHKPVLRQFPKVVLSPLKITAKKKKKEQARKLLRFRSKKCL